MKKESKYFVFDIETVAQSWESFDESQKEYLLRGAESEEDRDKKVRELALSPLCARIVCIGIAVMQRNANGTWTIEKEGALVLDEELESGKSVKKNLPSGASMIFSSEEILLKNFWKMLSTYSGIHLVSFNGRGFDAPFLMLRSAALRIRPSRNLMEGSKWNYGAHTDLADELSYYGFGNSGPQRRFNFDFYTRAFGITSPKSHGIDGGNVGKFFAEGKIEDIAAYRLRDVHATWELFLFWNEYLHF